MLYFHPTLFLKDERRRQTLRDIPVSFWRQIEDVLLFLKIRSCNTLEIKAMLGMLGGGENMSENLSGCLFTLRI